MDKKDLLKQRQDKAADLLKKGDKMSAAEKVFVAKFGVVKKESKAKK